MQRHEDTFQTLEQIATGRLDEHDLPYRKTYGFPGGFINAQHQALADASCDARGFIEVGGITGKLRREDALKLYELAYFTSGDIVELGTLFGLSAFIMMQAAETAGLYTRIVTVDILPERTEIARTNLSRYPGFSRVEFITADGIGALRGLVGRKFGLVFIDDEHAYWKTYWVCKSYLPKITIPRSFVAFHDFNDPRNADPAEVWLNVYPAVTAGLDMDRFEFWGIFGSIGLFRCR